MKCAITIPDPKRTMDLQLLCGTRVQGCARHANAKNELSASIWARAQLSALNSGRRAATCSNLLVQSLRMARWFDLQWELIKKLPSWPFFILPSNQPVAKRCPLEHFPATQRSDSVFVQSAVAVFLGCPRHPLVHLLLAWWVVLTLICLTDCGYYMILCSITVKNNLTHKNLINRIRWHQIVYQFPEFSPLVSQQRFCMVSSSISALGRAFGLSPVSEQVKDISRSDCRNL